ncbi:serine/threonine-protein kinase MARK2-like [Hipposideros larvatus]
MEYFFHEIDVDQNSGIDSYELRETICQGPFTSVVLGHHLLTRCQVAIKIIHERDYIIVHRNIKRELRCREHLHHHPNIIQLYHVVCSPDALFLVMEFAPNGSIQDYLSAHGRMPEALARKLFRQLVSALHYCHTKGIAHRNLEPKNVLLDWHMNAKVVDFGFAASFKEHELSMFCGNPLAAPPELFLEQIYHGPAMDMWGLGVLLYNMLTNTYPFTGKNLEEVKHKVLKGDYDIPSYFSSGVTILLKKLIHLNPKGRESLQSILPDPWLNEGYEEELEPYIEPDRDVIDPWVARKMMQLDFPWQDITGTLGNKNNNYLMATYYILTTNKDELQATPVKATVSNPLGLQSHSPSPAAEARATAPERSPRPRATTPERSPRSRATSPERSPRSRATTPERGPRSRATTPERGPRSRATTPERGPRSRATTPERGPRSRATTPERGPRSRATTPERCPGCRTTKPVSRPDSATSTPEHRPWYKTAAPKQGFRLVSQKLNPRIRRIVPDSSSESMTSTPESSVNSHTQDSLRLPRAPPAPRLGFGWSVTRRTRNFFRKLCCVPPRKGPRRCNQVAPL